MEEQQDTYTDQKFLGWYYDGDEKNSGFDLLADTQNIHKLFYDDIEDKEKIQDTVRDEESLIVDAQDRGSDLSYGSSNFGNELEKDIVNLLG